jgi:NADH:ubiquinone oxidoreductase subunit 4 (subunit M)
MGFPGTLGFAGEFGALAGIIETRQWLVLLFVLFGSFISLLYSVLLYNRLC